MHPNATNAKSKSNPVQCDATQCDATQCDSRREREGDRQARAERDATKRGRRTDMQAGMRAYRHTY
eukprot:3172124-Lingulodinium_polyedra.AAC.1